MERWTNRIVIVTGASSGIGAAICKLLDQNGMKVVGCARRIEILEEMKKELKSFYPYKCDMANENEIRGMFKWVEDHPDLGKIDVCIPNAGMSKNATFLNGSMEEWRNMLNINVLSLQLCAQLAVKSMLRNKIYDGQIIFMGSLFGHGRLDPNFPQANFYAATKNAVTALVEGWRQELRTLSEENNIRVSQLSPGVVKTGALEAAMPNIDKATAEAFYQTIPHLEVEDIAQCVKYVLECPIRMQIHDIHVRPTQQNF